MKMVPWAANGLNSKGEAMNYGQIKIKIQNLGFAEAEEMGDFDVNLIPNAVNLAISELVQTYPIIDSLEFSIDNDDTGIFELDMETEGNNFYDFVGEAPVIYGENGSYEDFTDYRIRANRIVEINADEYKGDFRIRYKRGHFQFTKDSSDNLNLELPLKVQHLVPLLASYYVWLDDDVQKAQDYYTQYETAFNTVQEETTKPRARILTGGI